MRSVLVAFCLLALATASVRASDDAGSDAEAAGDADAAAAGAAAEGGETETVTVEKVVGRGGSSVVELGSSAVVEEGVHDWADVVGRDLPVLVEFYLPTCGHCQGFAPEYERVAKAFHTEPVVVARIDANRWTSISDHYHVKSVPDIRYFPAGSRVDQQYIRARVATDIVEYVNEYAGTKVVFDYSFRQQLGTAASTDAEANTDAVVVDEGTCPVVHNSAAALVEADADAAVDAEAALADAEEEAVAAEEAVEDHDEAVDEAEELAEAEADEEDALEDAAADAEADEDAHETEAEIADEAELEGDMEAEAEFDEANEEDA